MMSSLEDSAKTIVRVVRVEKAFRCEYCEDVFYQEDALNSHRTVHKGVKNPFTCHICKVSFATYSRCTTHKTTHGFYKRSLADAKKQSDSGVQEAGPSATGILGYGGFPVVKHFLCEDCGRSYLHWTYLQVHRRMKHANEKFIFKCNLCKVTFPNSWSVAYHRKKVHGKTGQEDGGVTKIAREDYRIPCRDCDEVLPNKTALYKHRKKEHSDGTYSFSGDGNFNSSRTSCSKCGHNFSQPEDLLKHLTSAHGLQSQAAACSLCGSHRQGPRARGSQTLPCVCGPFTRPTNMRNSRILPGVRASVCPHCAKRYRSPSELKNHLRLKHSSHLVVIEVQGLNPSSEEILSHLKANNINYEKVLEITLMSFEKGTSSVIPHSIRALSALESTPKTVLNPWKPTPGSAGDFPTTSHSVVIPQEVPQLHISQSEVQNQSGYPISLTVSEEAMSALNIQLMLNEGVSGSDMVQLHVENMPLE